MALAGDELARATSAAHPAERLELLGAVRARLAALDMELRGVPGLCCLMAHETAREGLRASTEEMAVSLRLFDAALDLGAVDLGAAHLEDVNAALVGVRDSLWALAHDRLEALDSITDLARSLHHGAGEATPAGTGPGGAPLPPPALAALWAVHVALRSIDRLEVRGRDSAGLHVMVAGHGLDPSSPEVEALISGRDNGALFTSMAVRADDGCVSFVYKAAAEIGELGDNVAAIRRALSSDMLLARAISSPTARVTVLAHTRWASVGLISEPNAHPLNSDEPGRVATDAYVVGALNGDIDNYSDLVASERFVFPEEMTTDAKLVPTMVSRCLAGGAPVADAFGAAVGRFEGSVGIAANASATPDELYLALRGSGQGLNIGLAEDTFVVASEAYGLVEEATTYLRMDGEKGGQLVRCTRLGAGTLAGISRTAYDGSALPVEKGDLEQAQITTRDVDRRGYRHFLLKELYEAPLSVRKTLRGKLSAGADGSLSVHFGPEVVPPALVQALKDGRLRDVIVIGQGTAAVAGQAVAGAVGRALPHLVVKAMPATELSGWGPLGSGLPDDMSGTLVIAVSQSGTTTDTNRTVDLVRARGANVVAIVNRRNSDLVQKAHGVLYTSDGRDVEMAVASTKAFYSQVVAGHLLALALAGAAGLPDRARAQEILGALRQLPEQLEAVLAQRPEIARLATTLAPSRRSWAVVGSGPPDRVAAAEIRIKLSELCYKAIGLDSIEDKKHIDLSAEPLIIVCAASISGANAQDIAKETEIFRAHKAAPVVIVTETERHRFNPSLDMIPLPACHPELAFVLAAMAGHLFGYEAALTIDAQARPLREARSVLESALAGAGPDQADLWALAGRLETAALPALAGLRSGAYDGSLNASTAARLVSLLRYATGALPVEGYEAEMGKVGSPAAIAADLLAALGQAIDELTRPVDAIKHQAKTVTVGISRSEQPLLSAPLVAGTLAAGASMESLGYRALRTLAALGPAVEEVLGFTRYRVESQPAAPPDAPLEGAQVYVIDQGGGARGIASRTNTDHALRGTKHRVADKREVTVFRGLHDGRTGVIVPEVKDGQVTGLTLLHARFADVLSASLAKSVLQSYQGRYMALVDAVTEGQPQFDHHVLGNVPLVDLLTEPVAVLARHWSP